MISFLTIAQHPACNVTAAVMYRQRAVQSLGGTRHTLVPHHTHHIFLDVLLHICCLPSVFACCLQAEARLGFWCLSRQHFHPAVLEEHLVPLLNVAVLGLITGNKWESMQCVHQGLKCIGTLAKSIPAKLQVQAQLWLPSLWRLLLVQPITEYEQVCRQCCTALRENNMHAMSV